MKLPPPAVLAKLAPIFPYKYVFWKLAPSAVPVKLPPLKLAHRPVLVKLAGANFTGGGMWVTNNSEPIH